MDAEAAKLIGAGLAAIGAGMAAIGVGNVFGSFLESALRNPAAADGQQGRLFIGFAAAELLGLLSFVVAMILIFVVFYFLLIRPQRKKDKEAKTMLDNLKVGDRICTIGGIYGTIVSLKDDTVTLAVGSAKNQMVMARWAIRSVEDAPVENDAEPQV